MLHFTPNCKHGEQRWDFLFTITAQMYVHDVLVTPQIRSRFSKMEPGQSADLHSHDLGHEIFLILEGRVEFEIDGETEELGPGQMCIALANQPHTVRVVGDEPMTMYLSVTPHVQLTHAAYSSRRAAATQFCPPIAPMMSILICKYLYRNSSHIRYTPHNCSRN